MTYAFIVIIAAEVFTELCRHLWNILMATAYKVFLTQMLGLGREGGGGGGVLSYISYTGMCGTKEPFWSENRYVFRPGMKMDMNFKGNTGCHTTPTPGFIIYHSTLISKLFKRFPKMHQQLPINIKHKFVLSPSMYLDTVWTTQTCFGGITYSTIIFWNQIYMFFFFINELVCVLVWK